jgi:hypothetical protein
VKAEYGDRLGDVDVSRWNYAGRQVYHWMRDFEFGLVDTAELRRRARLLTWSERIQFFVPLLMYRSARRGLRAVGLRKDDRFLDMWPTLRSLDGVRGMREFTDWLSRTSWPSG